MKQCPECHEHRLDTVKICPCGYVFPARASGGGEGLTKGAMLFAVVACALLFWAVTMETAVHVPLDAAATAILPQEVVNVGLLHRQEMIFHAALSAAIISAILFAAGKIVDAITRADTGEGLR